MDGFSSLRRTNSERVLSRYFYSVSNHTQLPLSAAGWARDGAGGWVGPWDRFGAWLQQGDAEAQHYVRQV